MDRLDARRRALLLALCSACLWQCDSGSSGADDAGPMPGPTEPVMMEQSVAVHAKATDLLLVIDDSGGMSGAEGDGRIAVQPRQLHRK